MPRSLANGDYRLLMAIESSSRPNSWYRVLIDPRTNLLSCDCPAWTFGQRGGTTRECKHTDLALLLLQQQTPAPTNTPAANVRGNGRTRPAAEHPLITATKQQWAGLNGAWTIEERDQRFGGANYHFVFLQLVTGNGITASGVVAFASAFHPTTQSMVAGVPCWVGYGIAAEVARRAGYALAGQPPQHFKTERRAARAGAVEDLSLTGILRVGDQVNLGDGLTPTQRAENTLRLFLGDLYPQLERQHFLDVPSACFTIEQRVYRLRRDQHKQYERRVRCFERGRYVRDYCIKRAQDVPEADHWLTVFLGLISDEREVLSVVHEYNIFPPNSDGHEPEPIPAVWIARAS